MVTGRGGREGRGGGIKLEIALTSLTIRKDKMIADFFFAVFPPRRKADPVRGDKSLNTNLHKYKPLKSLSQFPRFSGGGILKVEKRQDQHTQHAQHTQHTKPRSRIFVYGLSSRRFVDFCLSS